MNLLQLSILVKECKFNALEELISKELFKTNCGHYRYVVRPMQNVGLITNCQKYSWLFTSSSASCSFTLSVFNALCRCCVDRPLLYLPGTRHYIMILHKALWYVQSIMVAELCCCYELVLLDVQILYNFNTFFLEPKYCKNL